MPFIARALPRSPSKPLHKTLVPKRPVVHRAAEPKTVAQPLTANLPEVKAVLAKYEPREGVVGRPYERILKSVAQLDSVIMQARREPGALADLLLAQNGRKILFALEGQLRIYQGKLGKLAEKPLADVKKLEDALGAWSLYEKEIPAQIKDKNFPKAVVKHLEKVATVKRDTVKEILAKDWLPDADKRNQVPVLNRMLRGLREADFGSYQADRAYLQEALGAQFEKTEKFKVDFNDLQGGVHELRRKLRWPSIYIDALDGAVQLSAKQNPLHRMRKMLSDVEAKSPFVTDLPGPAREAQPIVMSKSLYIAVSKLIREIGVIKDKGEYVEFLSEAFVEAGKAKSVKKAEPMVRQLLGLEHATHEWIARESEKAYRAFMNEGVLPALRAELAATP
ncbi:MAG: hypothetical protein K1X64_00630 [Myxococcaceae bacterium]|nr:hypothetical protein [Myxococcaceae bacterium]